MDSIRIEEVGDINSEFNYLEVFFADSMIPFLEIQISAQKKLVFTFFASKQNLFLSVHEWEHILFVANDFLPRVLKDEEYFNKLYKK